MEKLESHLTNKIKEQVIVQEPKAKLLPKNPYEEVILDSLQEISSFKEANRGLSTLKKIIETKGLQLVVDTCLDLQEDIEPENKSDFFTSFLETVHTFATPRSLPINKVKEILEIAQDGIEWIAAKSYLDFRVNTEECNSLNKTELTEIAYTFDIPFWDITKVNDKAIELITQNAEAYYGLLEDYYFNFREMHLDYNGAPDNDIIINKMEALEKLDTNQLISTIDPVYSFRLLENFLGPETIKKEFLLETSHLRKKISKFLKENDQIFFQSAWRTETKQKEKHLILEDFDKYNLIPLLGDYAESEGKSDPESKFGYALNCTTTPLSKNIKALYSPTGRFLSIFETNEDEPKYNGTAQLMNLAHGLTHKVKPYNSAFDQYNISLTAALLNWEQVPEDIKKELKESFEQRGLDLDETIKSISHLSFDSSLDLLRDYYSVIPDTLPTKMANYVNAELEKRSEELELKLVSPESLLSDMKKEFGKFDLTLDEMKKIVTNVNFRALTFLQKNLNFDLNNITTRETFALLNFLKTENGDTGFQMIKSLIGNISDFEAKKNRIRSFLSLETDSKMKKAILSIDRDNDQKTADQIFAKYSELVDLTISTKNKIIELLPHDTNISEEEISNIITKLMNNANELLVKMSQIYDKNIIIEKLNKYKSDLLLTASLFRTLKKESHREDISLEDIKGVHYQTITLDEKLSEKDAQSMIQIYSDNYKDKPQLQKKLVEGFRELLANKSEKTELYMLKQNDDVLAFMRFDNTGSNHKYAGSLNVSPTLRGSAIGSAFFEEAMNKQAEKFVLDADTDPTTEVCSYYIEKGGFVVDKVQSNYADTGKTIFGIERDDKRKDYYFRDKDISSNDLIKEHEKNFKNNIYKGEPPYLVLSFPANSKDLYLTSEKLVNEKKYRMTRYFLSDDKETVYCAFERAGS